MRTSEDCSTLLADVRAELAPRPRLRRLWQLVAIVAVVRLISVGIFMTDTRFDWGALPRDPFYRTHSCLTAYWRAAMLARERVPNIYDPALYEQSTIEGFEVDSYIYPPQFLLLPVAATSLTRSFAALRSVWFFIELGLFGWTFARLAAWIGGKHGARLFLCWPLVVTGVPILLGLQMGNFHLAAICLAVLAMLEAEKERTLRGGLWMAVATVAKVFPSILLVLLLARGRPRLALWTSAWMAALTIVTVLFFGEAPVSSFLEFQLPRLSTSDPDFWEAPALFGTVNMGIVGVLLKLKAMGLATGPAVEPVAATVYMVLLLVGVLVAGMSWERARKSSPGSELDDDGEARLAMAKVWLAFLALASLRTPFLPEAYAAVPTLWLLGLSISARRRAPLAWIAIAVLFSWVVMPSRLLLPNVERFRFLFALCSQLVLIGVALSGAVALWRPVLVRRVRP